MRRGPHVNIRDNNVISGFQPLHYLMHPEIIIQQQGIFLKPRLNLAEMSTDMGQVSLVHFHEVNVSVLIMFLDPVQANSLRLQKFAPLN